MPEILYRDHDSVIYRDDSDSELWDKLERTGRTRIVKKKLYVFDADESTLNARDEKSVDK